VQEKSSVPPRHRRSSVPEPELGTNFADQKPEALPRPIHIPEAGHAIDACPTLKFSDRSEFLSVLRQRVDDYFCTTGQPRRDCPQIYVKTAIILSWFATSYAMLIFLASTWWQAIPLAISTGLAMAAVGFNIQHDGGHRAYSDNPWVNKLAALTLDLLGGSSYVWDRKHNSIHHTYANITGYDDDINIGFLGRLSPHQRRLKFHRLQHFYLWLLYGLMTIKWQVYDDFRDVLKGQIDGHRFVRPAGWNLMVFIVGKLVFFSLALMIPMLLCEFSAVLFCYAVAAFVQGVTLSVVFQLAHCVEDADFPMPDPETGRVENDWAVHQVETTVNFATRNRFVAWLTGGLNFQIEHHLFPRICHVNYPAISRLVEDTCREFEIEYAVHETLFAGVASHFQWLRRMGMPEAA
jgi:linoleoyl-CoA desaturase